MIQSLEANNFKGLTGINFRTGKLTLLTGTNSVGKSSVIQLLLLLRLASLRTIESAVSILPLNGPYDLSLGEFLDILRHDVEGRDSSEIAIHATIDDAEYVLTLQADVETARYAKFTLQPNTPKAFLAHSLGSFCYLSAEREGPRSASLLQSLPKERVEIGARGQFVANVLQLCERDSVASQLEHPTVPGQRFLKQVESWLAEFVPQVEIRIDSARELDLAAIRFKRGGLSAEWERPSNTGFGVSYCLPIVVAGLVAKRGSVLVIDSPEVHLHPSGQSAMGSFLSRLAAAGVQVVAETHSDHLLNGVRLAAIDTRHPVDRKDVVINHLRLSGERLLKEEVTIDDHGSLSARPPEFFDQAEHDLAEIVKRRFPNADS
jgi:predicted ATPase